MLNGQAAAVGSQPVGMTSGGAHIPEKAGAGAQPATAQAHQCQRSPHTEVLIEIPPEAMTDDLGITEGPLGPGGPSEGAPGGERGEESSGPPPGEEGDYPDLGLLTHPDELCAQDKYFLAKVHIVLHPRFLAELLSPDPELDLLALPEELEKEEGLSILQLEHKQLLELRQEEGVQAPRSHGAPQLDSRPSEPEASQGTQKHGHGPQLGASDQACPPEAGCGQCQMPDAGVSKPEAFAASPGCQESPPLKAGWLHPAPQARGCTSPSLAPRLTSAPGETCAGQEALGPMDRPSEDEEELPSLAYLLASTKILPSWGLRQRPTLGSAPLCPGVPQAQSPQRPGLSPTGPPGAKASSQPLCAGTAPAEKTPLPGASLWLAGGLDLGLGLGRPSQPQKRKGDPFVLGKCKKRHYSQ